MNNNANGRPGGGLLDFVSSDALQRGISLSDSDARTITAEVIGRVNGEFNEATLRAPSDADRQTVRARIGVLVAGAVRRTGLGGLSAVIGADILADVLGSDHCPISLELDEFALARCISQI